MTRWKRVVVGLVLAAGVSLPLAGSADAKPCSGPQDSDIEGGPGAVGLPVGSGPEDYEHCI